jgi:mono/diheme cytochrome c family protein
MLKSTRDKLHIPSRRLNRGVIAGMMMLAGIAVLLAACGPALVTAPTPEATHTPMPPPPVMPPNKESWILVDLPPDATQLDHGREIYRLVCSACHAYTGEGLTDAWRATWDPKDQNCWQSKCHGANHPPDGFVLPIAPAIVGRQALAPFQTAADLRAYIQTRMPWHNPNSMTAEEGWAVTAYVIKLNRMSPPAVLDDTSAVAFRLNPAGADPTTIPPTTAAPANDANELWLVGAGAGVLALVVLVMIRVRRSIKTKTSA